MMTCLCINSWSSVYAGEDAKLHYDLETHGRQAHRMKNTEQMLPTEAALGTLRTLKKGEDREIALQAAWEEAVQRNSLDERVTEVESVRRFAQFVGFVDGRLPVTLPDWWEDIVSSAVQNETQEVVFSRRALWLYEGTESGLKRLKGFSAGNVEGRIEMTFEGRQFRLVDEVVHEAQKMGPVEIVSPVMDHDSAFVVIGSMAATPCILVKIDLESGKTAWRSKIRADDSVTNRSGRHYHFVEPRIGNDGQIYVFGIGAHCAYIEEFSSNDGSCQFRFSTTHHVPLNHPDSVKR